MAFIIAQIVGFVTCITAAISMLSKKMSTALIFQVVGNILVTLSFWLLGTISASIVCIIATIQTLVLYILGKKNIEPKSWFLPMFIVAYLAAVIFTYKSPIDLLSVVTALSFCIGVSQKEPSKYRKIMTLNSCAWIVLSFLTRAYTNILTYTVILISIIVGMIKYDFKKESK